MTLTIYHNPRCSKSRQTLHLLTESGVSPVIVDYLESPPPASTILTIAGLLDGPVADLLRRNEPDFKQAADLPDLADDDALAEWLALHPRVLQRPIVHRDAPAAAVVGRPPENVLALLPA